MHANKGNNAASIKRHNRSLIINMIQRHGRISRIELSRITGLSRGGLTPIINEMLSMELVRETGQTNTAFGRKPVLLELDPDWCCAVAVDWTRIGFNAALINLEGRVIDINNYRISKADTLETVLTAIRASIKRILSAGAGRRIIGIGVVAPGPIYHQDGIILCPPNFHGWSNIRIKAILQEALEIPVYIENNANAHGISEKNIGWGTSFNSFVHLIVDEGIGAGIIIDNRLFRGNGGFGSEIGHISINMNGERCACGNTGCLEMYATVPKLLKYIETALDLGASSPFLASIRAARSLEWEDIIQGLNYNDNLCINALKKEAFYLGVALTSITNCFEPQAIILGSKIAKAGRYLIEPLKSFLNTRTFTKDYQLPEIHNSNLQNASLLGGAMMVMEKYISGDMGGFEASICA